MPESEWNPAGEIRMVYKGPPHYRNVLHEDRIEPIITESSFGTKKEMVEGLHQITGVSPSMIHNCLHNYEVDINVHTITNGTSKNIHC